jgi:hypothetical protein
VDACAQSIVSMMNYQRLLNRIDLEELKKAQQELDSIASQRIIQDMLAY